MQKRDQNSPGMVTNQQGLTLVELILSLSIGLIVSASAFQLFKHSTRSHQIQLSVAEVQDAALFSFSTIKQEIAKANLGAASSVKQQSAWTGIVLTGSFPSSQMDSMGKPLQLGNLRGVKGVDAKLLTRSQAGPSNVISPSRSDQLTIQYQAPFDSFDCEGDRVNQGDMVIERFFTRSDRQRAANESKALAIVLACDAGRYQLPATLNAEAVTANSVPLVGFGDNGVIIINRIDYLDIKLGVKLDKGLAYMPIDAYLAVSASDETGLSYVHQGPIVAIQIGIIGRGNRALLAQDRSQDSFIINGSERVIKQKTPSYIRRSLQSVVYLRNSHSTP